DLIAVYKGEILEEYHVKGYGPDKVEPKRVAFDLEEKESSPLKGKQIDYPTANPCTIIDPADFGLNVSVPTGEKQYKFVEPRVTQDQMIEVLVKGLGRKLTEQEIETI